MNDAETSLQITPRLFARLMLAVNKRFVQIRIMCQSRTQTLRAEICCIVYIPKIFLKIFNAKYVIIKFLINFFLLRFKTKILKQISMTFIISCNFLIFDICLGDYVCRILKLAARFIG